MSNVYSNQDKTREVAVKYNVSKDFRDPQRTFLATQYPGRWVSEVPLRPANSGIGY